MTQRFGPGNQALFLLQARLSRYVQAVNASLDGTFHWNAASQLKKMTGITLIEDVLAIAKSGIPKERHPVAKEVV